MKSESSRSKSADQVAEAYASPPWWYDVRGFFILLGAYNSSLGAQLRFFAPNLGPRHLEVACGTGTLLGLMLGWRRRRKRPAVDVTAIDYAPSMLEGAKRRFAGNPGINLQHADASALPFQGGAFDTLNIANAVHCIPDVDGALAEAFRVLKPGGSFAANVLLFPRGPRPLRGVAESINRWGMRKGILVTPYDREDIRARLVRAGFEIAFEEVRGNCYNVRARKPLSG